jgi:hypothetical protein
LPCPFYSVPTIKPINGLITKKCYLCVPTNLYEEALNDDGHEGSTRQDTVQNFIERQGVLNAYIASGSDNKIRLLSAISK